MAKKTVAELEAELRMLRSQIRSTRKSTKLKTEISHAKFGRRKASFQEFVGKFRRKGYTFGRAVKAAQKEYKRLK